VNDSNTVAPIDFHRPTPPQEADYKSVVQTQIKNALNTTCAKGPMWLTDKVLACDIHGLVNNRELGLYNVQIP